MGTITSKVLNSIMPLIGRKGRQKKRAVLSKCWFGKMDHRTILCSCRNHQLQMLVYGEKKKYAGVAQQVKSHSWRRWMGDFVYFFLIKEAVFHIVSNQCLHFATNPPSTIQELNSSAVLSSLVVSGTGQVTQLKKG